VNRLIVVLAAAALAGCGGGEHGHATLWITRDHGTQLMLHREVPAGLTAMQALDRVAKIETRYGGRYVQAIEGVEGSLSNRRDWFYFINGYEGDRSAAEYRLHDGDVEWWDFRPWKTQMRVPIVVGVFPEPFLHGFDGKRLPTFVVYFARSQRPAAEAVARLLHGRATTNVFDARGKTANILTLLRSRKAPSFYAGPPSVRPAGPVTFAFAGDPALLLRKPPFGHLRYQVKP